MKIFADRHILRLFVCLGMLFLLAFGIAQGVLAVYGFGFCWPLAVLLLLLGCGVLGSCYLFFIIQSRILTDAVTRMERYLDGARDTRIPCEEEGDLYRLFHTVNTLAAVLNAHAENEGREKQFLKNTISDISHQLKTPLAALTIYNDLMQDDNVTPDEVKAFAALSGQELCRTETLVQNLLKITRLDAGAIQMDKTLESLPGMMQDLALQFSYRAKQEHKHYLFSGAPDAALLCDRDWMLEALGNLVKNAFDHTDAGDAICVIWQQSAGLVQIQVQDTGRGIHAEDLPHIFKRFYRSRFSNDTQGIGLGLPLAKSIVEANGGTLEVDSTLGRGSVFTASFLIPTKL